MRLATALLHKAGRGGLGMAAKLNTVGAITLKNLKKEGGADSVDVAASVAVKKVVGGTAVTLRLTEATLANVQSLNGALLTVSKALGESSCSCSICLLEPLCDTDAVREACLCERVGTEVVLVKQRTMRAVSSLPDCLAQPWAASASATCSRLSDCCSGAAAVLRRGCGGPKRAVASLNSCIRRREGVHGGSSPGQPRQQTSVLLTALRAVEPQAAA